MTEPTLSQDLREAGISLAGSDSADDRALAERIRTAIPVIEAAVRTAADQVPHSFTNCPNEVGAPPKRLRAAVNAGLIVANLSHDEKDWIVEPTALGRQLLAMQREGGR